MTSVDRVKTICKTRKIPISKLERELGFANGYIGQLKKGTMPAERLAAISEYLGVPHEYLLNGDAMEPVPPEQSTRGMTPEEREAHYRGLHLSEQKEKPIGQEADGLTEEELLRISAAMAQMNKEGRERAVELVEDLAAGGRFKKPGKDTMGKEA